MHSTRSAARTGQSAGWAVPASGDVCLSGGAPGADLAWGRAARRRGDTVVHFSFAGHRTRARSGERCVLTAAELAEADPQLARANRRLARHWPPRGTYAANLLRRDWHQVKDAASLYAIAAVDEEGTIAGGTAWAVTMFLARHDDAACAAYLFDQGAGQWLRWDAGWRPIPAPPVPCGRWAGIGTRALSRAGRAAIRALFAQPASTTRR